jgi:8-oxo-dGTP diphosphatase
MSLPGVCVVYLLRPRPNGQEVLLGRKLTGLGTGKVVAPRGKLESGETPAEAAIREVREEVGIDVDLSALELVGELTYSFPAKPSWSQKSWAFRAVGEFGDPVASHELAAAWTPVTRLPLWEMWDDARYWLPLALAGTIVKATFEYGEDLSTVSRSDHPNFAARAI